MHRARLVVPDSIYLCDMSAHGVRRRCALLLLGLMAFFTLPRTWFHHCDGAEVHAVADGGVVVHADDHCPVCDQLSSSLVDDAAGPVSPRSGEGFEVADLISEGPLLGPAFDRPSRGPPAKC